MPRLDHRSGRSRQLPGGDSDLEADYADEESSLSWCEAPSSGEGGCHAGPAHDLEASVPVDLDGEASAGVPRERGYMSQSIRNLSRRHHQDAPRGGK